MVSRNAPIVAAITRNSTKSQAMDFVNETGAKAADQQFEYKDFNFISKPAAREIQNKSATIAVTEAAPYTDSPIVHRERHVRTNSPRGHGSGRYEQVMHNSEVKMTSQNQYLMQYLGQKKRLSTDVVSSQNPIDTHPVNQVGISGSIKIQIDNNKSGGDPNMAY